MYSMQQVFYVSLYTFPAIYIFLKCRMREEKNKTLDFVIIFLFSFGLAI